MEHGWKFKSKELIPQTTRTQKDKPESVKHEKQKTDRDFWIS